MNKSKRTNIYTPEDSGFAFLIALFVPTLLMLLLLVIFGQGITNLTIVASLVPQIAFLIAFFVISERRKVNYVCATKLNFKISLPILLCVLAIGLVALFGFSPLVSMFDYLVESWGYKGGVGVDVSTFGMFFASIFYVALAPAICEELVFRGVITNGLKKYGSGVAIVLSAVFFALMHQNLQQFIYQLFLGGVMAYIVLSTNSIVYTMALHFFNNFTILLLSHLSVGQTSAISYSNVWNVVYPVLLAVLSALVIFGLLWLIEFIKKKQAKRVKSKQTESTSILNEQTAQNANAQIANAQTVQKTSVAKQEQNKTQTSLVLDDEQLVKSDKLQWKLAMKNPVLIASLAIGIVVWLFAVISSF